MTAIIIHIISMALNLLSFHIIVVLKRFSDDQLLPFETKLTFELYFLSRWHLLFTKIQMRIIKKIVLKTIAHCGSFSWRNINFCWRDCSYYLIFIYMCCSIQFHTSCYFNLVYFFKFHFFSVFFYLDEQRNVNDNAMNTVKFIIFEVIINYDIGNSNIKCNDILIYNMFEFFVEIIFLKFQFILRILNFFE